MNLASPIADAAGPGDVLASEAVVRTSEDAAFAFERTEDVELKGLPEPIPLFRVRRGRSVGRDQGAR
jgi:class 3 adenylate cyclase